MAVGEQFLTDLVAQEESGIEMPGDLKNEPDSKAPCGSGLFTNAIPQDTVLLIPDSASPDGVDMFDPRDGVRPGILITDAPRLDSPQCAIKGSDGNICLSDQIKGAGCICMIPLVLLLIFNVIQVMGCTM